MNPLLAAHDRREAQRRLLITAAKIAICAAIIGLVMVWLPGQAP